MGHVTTSVVDMYHTEPGVLVTAVCDMIEAAKEHISHHFGLELTLH
jgi:hypothetical protein